MCSHSPREPPDSPFQCFTARPGSHSLVSPHREAPGHRHHSSHPSQAVLPRVGLPAPSQCYVASHILPSTSHRGLCSPHRTAGPGTPRGAPRGASTPRHTHVSLPRDPRHPCQLPGPPGPEHPPVHRGCQRGPGAPSAVNAPELPRAPTRDGGTAGTPRIYRAPRLSGHAAG